MPFPIRVIRNDDEPVLLGGERPGGRGRRRRADLLPEQRCRPDHRRVARLHGRDDDVQPGGRGRRSPDLPAASRRSPGWIEAPPTCRSSTPGWCSTAAGPSRSPASSAPATTRSRRGRPAVRDRPALTAACLLVRLDAFREVGGFSPEYDYGIEDVDLCLKLRAAGGRLVYDGRAALWHHESATRAADRARFKARVAAQPERLHRHLGATPLPRCAARCAARRRPVLERPVPRRDHPDGRRLSGRERRSATARELGDALEELGWRVSCLSSADEAARVSGSVDRGGHRPRRRV